MKITGVGSSFSYIYNKNTGKLSTKDGSYDEFVSYFNGELSGEKSTSLNGYDVKKKSDINCMLNLWLKQDVVAVGARDVFNDTNAVNGCEYEISGELVDAVTGVYYVNGEKIFSAAVAMDSYTYDELKSFLNFASNTQRLPFKTHDTKAYDSATNSLNIAVGDVFDLKNGCRLEVKEDYVECSMSDLKAQLLADGLASFIHFADQQSMYGVIKEESVPMLLELLRELGVDTSKEFTINETKCHIVNGRIMEVGNKSGVPSTIYNKAVKRYEEWANKLLSERD